MKISLTRRYDFAASHRLHAPKLSAEENRRIYGKCNNPYGHGHNYALEVTITGPVDPATGKIKGETVQDQTRQCLTNISAILKAAGSSMDKVAMATVILLNEEDFAGMNEEWVKWFPTDPPARQGAKLPVRMPGMKVSIAVIAEA